MSTLVTPPTVWPSAPLPARRPLWSLVALIATLGAATAVAVSGAVVIAAARDVWVSTLVTPAWTPPDWAFVAAWIVAHVLVGLAGWRMVMRSAGSSALTLWTVQLGLELGWTVIFFGLWLPTAAVVAGVAEAAIVTAAIVTAWARSRAAALLLVPYLGWVWFLIALNGAIIALN